MTRTNGPADGSRDAAANTEVPARPGLLATLPVASLIAVGFMGSVIVTPLYALFQRKFGFSEITLTLIYATYVVGNVTALLLFGQISDQLGRKRVGLPALAVAAASALLFLFADSTRWLFLARLLIGLAVGILSGTGTAWLAEQFGERDRSRATFAATTANFAGIAVGPLLGGLLAQYARAPLVLPFLVYIAILIAVAIAIALTPEPRQSRIARPRELRLELRVGVPRRLLPAFATPAVTGFVIFALGGLYYALIPGILIHDLNEKNIAVGGAVVAGMAVVGVTAIAVSRALEPATAMVGALAVSLPAAGLVVAAQAARSLPLLLIAAALAGTAQGFGYRGGLEVINGIAPDARRAEVVSSYFIACFVGNSLPVIGIGVLTTLFTPLTASSAFTCTVAALSVGALLWHRTSATSTAAIPGGASSSSTHITARGEQGQRPGRARPTDVRRRARQQNSA